MGGGGVKLCRTQPGLKLDLPWPVTGSLLFLKKRIPKREIDFKQNNVPDTKIDGRTALCDADTLPAELLCPLGPWDLMSLN